MDNSYQNRLRYVYKVTSSRIQKANYQLSLTYQEASINGELAEIGNHQVLRFIDQLRSQKKMEEQWQEIRQELKRIKALKTTVHHKRTIKKLHEDQNKLKFVADYLLVIIENNKDYDRLNASNGFELNGKKYKRLMATTCGAKSSTVIYVSEDIHAPLERRLNNGRNPNMEMIPAKLEAYKALACNASTPVSHPERVLVVPDSIIGFCADIIQTDDAETKYPQVEKKQDQPVQLSMSDGFGLISPALSNLWAKELGHDYIPRGFCIRNSFCKGMVFTFDYQKLADRIARQYMVMDAWGESVDIREVDLIITTSMLKLWQAYTGINDYLLCCGYHGYTFSVTKVTPEELKDE
ncbi:RNA dependent RNA polymerase [Paenibacillus sp. TSA_86.1]|uniref:RNA dependent RNA polymerase n=1 Tax=Paenibacillus sp. TSA_86.1 TaxID=3415649 RepID=UPI004046332C